MIKRVLVANRGEIARRIFRTCWSLGIDTVAVYSDPDAREPHAREAEISVRLPGADVSSTYLNTDLILEAAATSGADAVHPGYGFLAENSEFARAVLDAGLIWIGPAPGAIATMGSKLASKALVRTADVPTLPDADLTGLTNEEVLTEAEDIGFPVLVKASAGGGGKGMRVVDSAVDLIQAVAAARRESANAFGDDTVFLEKYLDSPRHIEVQVFGDSHGNLVSMFERECSIQRRHQKIIEECPSPVVDDALRSQLGDAAVRVARAVDYTGAGTVEFLVEGEHFYFLEMNTRLQVEHPVTEMVTGLDLVELQIVVANGLALPAEALRPTMSGHAIEARLYAEDPAHGYLPVTGTMHRFEFPEVAGLRVDSGIETGSAVSVNYDPMLAKAIGYAASRAEAASTLSGGLRGARIHGTTTNRDLLVRILEHPDFAAGETDTRFLDRHDITKLARPLAEEVDEAFAARAAALADQAAERAVSPVLGSIPSGWRNVPRAPQNRVFAGAVSEHHVSYSISREDVVFEGEDHAHMIECTPARVVFDRCGTLHEFDIARYGAVRHVDSPRIPVRLTAVPRFPEPVADEAEGSLHSPMPGKIVRVDVIVGQKVAAGEVLMVLEAMKMEHTITAPYAGVVARADFHAGDQVEAGAILAVVEAVPS
ncbi:MAG: ATP-grasp domain-containing protein [Acidimicrobiia bacterium]|nr:ATP-grasp domain-containing protein [Acidimicrobiia bacterium]